eukprot:14057431-Alexandrium_andersonii.AAC.1
MHRCARARCAPATRRQARAEGGLAVGRLREETLLLQQLRHQAVTLGLGRGRATNKDELESWQGAGNQLTTTHKEPSKARIPFKDPAHVPARTPTT